MNIKELLLECAEEGFTQSEITTLDNCAMLWNWRYLQLLRKKGSFSWALIYGSAWHKTMEHLHAMWLGDLEDFKIATLQIPEHVILTNKDEQQREYWQSVLEVQVERYAAYNQDFPKVATWTPEDSEFEAVAEFEGIKLRGQIDLVFTQNGKLSMKDFKTTSRIDAGTIAGWDFRFQFQFYSWLYQQMKPNQKVERFFVDAIVKPAIRLGKNETLGSFCSRLRGNMIAEPQKYFYQPSAMVVTQKNLERFQETLLRPKITRLKLMLDWANGLTSNKQFDIIAESLLTDMNTETCIKYGSICEFLPLCSKGSVEAFQYEQRPTKHEELATLQSL